MRIELLTVGDELLLGHTVDTNAAFIARVLAEIGVELARHETVGDDPDAIAAAARDALERTGAVLTTGGLGPTADDRTRPAIARVFARPLRLDDAVLAGIEARFRAWGRGAMPRGNVQQAMVPEGARVLENPYGSAPGLWLEDDRGRWAALLPGVPREMRGMMHDVILPLLRSRAGTEPRVVLSRTLRTTGIGESALAELLGDAGGDVVNGLPLAYLPGWAGTDLRVTARDVPRAEAERALDVAAQALRARAGRFIYGEDTADLADLVLRRCRERSLHLATAESCTGGMIGERVTAIPGSSDVYRGGIVAYDDAVKRRILGVPQSVLSAWGAVSEPVAVLMATGAREVIGAAVGVGITGIAGPDGGSADKPVGTVWIAAQVGQATTVRGRVFTGNREEIRQRAAQAALDQVRRMLEATP